MGACVWKRTQSYMRSVLAQGWGSPALSLSRTVPSDIARGMTKCLAATVRQDSCQLPGGRVMKEHLCVCAAHPPHMCMLHTVVTLASVHCDTSLAALGSCSLWQFGCSIWLWQRSVHALFAELSRCGTCSVSCGGCTASWRKSNHLVGAASPSRPLQALVQPAPRGSAAGCLLWGWVPVHMQHQATRLALFEMPSCTAAHCCSHIESQLPARPAACVCWYQRFNQRQLSCLGSFPVYHESCDPSSTVCVV
jgi:hypothetical protein